MNRVTHRITVFALLLLAAVWVAMAVSCDDEEAVPALVSRFTDADVNVRWAAVRSVGQLGGRDAESALNQLIASGKQAAQVEQAAREALRRLGGAVPLSEEAKRLFEHGGKS